MMMMGYMPPTSLDDTYSCNLGSVTDMVGVLTADDDDGVYATYITG